MCNCRLKYPRGMSIVTCVVLYVALIGLLVAYFQPYWVVVPANKEFGCLNNSTKEVEKLTTTSNGACGFSGMCYPMQHDRKVDMTCYPAMEKEQCVWYLGLEKIGNFYDQVCSLLFLAGLGLCVFAWFLSMVGCCSLTCCCCNLYTAISILTTFGAVAVLVAGVLWMGFMGEYEVGDAACVNVFCQNLGLFDLGDCTIGWSAYLGFASWVLLVVGVVVTSCTASHYAAIIQEEKIPPKNLVNPYEKKSRFSEENAFYFRENKSAR